MKPSRMAAPVALVAGALVVVLVLFGGGGHHYSIVFETGSQLVDGNQVLVGGQPVGKVDSIDLTDDGQARVDVTVDQPLHEGTTAIVRATSLSGIANRYIAILPGPNSAPQLDDGATLAADKTTSAVDLDQLFDTFDARTRRALQDVIRGYGTVYSSNTEQANETYRYLAPSLQASDRLLQELTRDQQTFSDFLVSGSRVLGAVAQRRDDLSALTSNANHALGAIAQQNAAFDRSLTALPPAMRQANTTFVNLRAALDDLTPVVRTAKRSTQRLPAFLRDLRPVADRAVPVVGDLSLAVNRPGAHDDATDALRDLPDLQQRARATSKASIAAMNDTQPNLAIARAYSPDLLAFITKFGQITAYYDADGHYARVMPAVTGAFRYDPATSRLEPTYSSPSLQLSFFDGADGTLDPGGFARCPGAATQPATDGSNPFVDPPWDGGLPVSDCNPGDVPPGP